MYQEMDNYVAKFLRKSVKEEKAGMNGKECAYALDESLYGYLFYSSSIIASLLHDIGYPIAYIGRTVKELGSFLPFSHIFVQEVETISTIHAVLQDSLLYKVMSPEAVAERVEKKDHGALSAVILLYKYYDNGKMALLSPIKRAAIELAALMIYNHTLGYRHQGKEKSIYYKNIFWENPMSFLFRLCDDLQEWDRVYFDVSQKSNFFVCGNCFMPLTRQANDTKAQDNGQIDSQTPYMQQKYYSCWCGSGKGRNTTTFAYRRLVNINACTELECEKNKRGQVIRIRYNKGRLMQIAAYSPSFAVKRAEGVWEIKQMLDNQKDFPKTFVDFCVSNNPILLKAEILKEWLCKNKCKFMVLKQEYNSELSDKMPMEQLEILTRIVTDMGLKDPKLQDAWNSDKLLLQKAMKKVNSNWKPNIKKSSIKYIWEKAYFYYCLSLWGSLLQKLDKKAACQWIYSEKGNELQMLCDALQKNFLITDRTEKLLLEDFTRQKLCQFDENQFWNIDTEQEKQLYLDSFLLGKFNIDIVHSYVQEKEYGKVKEKAWSLKGQDLLTVLGYDYYSDYYFYYTISEMIDNIQKS
ncbi:MAG: hypothetical protein NC548_10395 [Lachnospiraceae bacterium]|nr:hypothetical protein [Lachnospiraceae bacterium]